MNRPIKNQHSQTDLRTRNKKKKQRSFPQINVCHVYSQNHMLASANEYWGNSSIEELCSQINRRW